MSMLNYNEIVGGKFIELDGAPYEVLDSHSFRKQQRKPVNQTKLRNLITGKVVEHAFHVSDKAEEANIESRQAKFLYQNKGEWWFCDPSDPAKRFTLPEDQIGQPGRYMKINSEVETVVYAEKVIGVRLPVKVELAVKEAAPAVKGNTVQGGTKEVTLETDATIMVPMFINEGDIIRINTDSGDYVERVEKK